MQEWYAQKRLEIEEAFQAVTPGLDEIELVTSPSSRYSLEIIEYSNGPHAWCFSRGIVRDTQTGLVLADIKRNYGIFPFSWAENHPAGHDYLICSEDYQGQTVIELDTGNRVDYIPDSAEQGSGFCWVAHYPSPDGRFIFVDGCYWGCPYELVLFDFTQPMQLPYAEIKQWPVFEVKGFQPDGSFQFRYLAKVRNSMESVWTK